MPIVVVVQSSFRQNFPLTANAGFSTVPHTVLPLHGVTKGRRESSEIMRYRSRCFVPFAGIHSALFLVLLCGSAVCLERNPIPDTSGMRQGSVSWMAEPVYQPNRLHVSTLSMEKYKNYRVLTCRDEKFGQAHPRDKLSEEEYERDYLEWEQIEFNRALRDTLVPNEKDFNTAAGQEIMKKVPGTMLDTHFSTKCIPRGESINQQQTKMQYEQREKDLFEDVLINKVMPFLDWGDDSSDLVSYVLEIPDEPNVTVFAPLVSLNSSSSTTATTSKSTTTTLPSRLNTSNTPSTSKSRLS